MKNPYSESAKLIIKAFTIVAILCSVYQQFDFAEIRAQKLSRFEPILPENGATIDQMKIILSFNFQKDMKKNLISHHYNIQLEDKQLDNYTYWKRLILTYGHIFIIFFFVNRYQASTQTKFKTTFLIVGIIVVLIWLIYTGYFRKSVGNIEIQFNQEVLYSSQYFETSEVMKFIKEQDDRKSFLLFNKHFFDKNVPINDQKSTDSIGEGKNSD